MSIFRRKQGDSLLSAVVTSFAQDYKQKGTEFASSEHTSSIFSLESLNDHQAAELERHGKELESEIRSTFSEHDVSLESFQLDAGVIAAMAAGDPELYHQKATNTEVVSVEGVTVIQPDSVGRYGNLDFVDKVSLESFDNQELEKHIPYSIAFNVQASRQDEFGEAFYPTVVVTPDQAGLDLTIDRTMVMGEQRHSSSGKVTDWNRRALLSGIQDHELLNNNAVKLVPVVAADGSNADKFIDASLVAPKEIMVNKVPVRTAPLKPGVEIDFLGISSHPGLIGAGIMDSTDSLDARFGLDLISLAITGEAEVDGELQEITEVIPFSVSRMPRADFVKSVEGDHREMTLVFRTRDLLLTGDTKTDDGADSVLLASLKNQNLRLRLRVSINGTVNLETAVGNIYPSPVEVQGLYSVDAADPSNVTELSLTSAESQQILSAFQKMEVAGYTVNSTRSNANLRTRGLLLNVNRQKERYTVPMGSPISVPAPISSDRSASDLTALISAARIRTSNNAVTSLLNYADTLKAYVFNRPSHDEEGLAIEGIGRYLVNPFYEEIELDLEKEINSLTSHERNADVKALLVDTIREIAYRMYRDSNYQAAIDAMTGTSGQKPKLIIGTDRTIANHLMVQGDSRTAGIDFEHHIVSSDDKRMFGKIVFSFVRANSQGGDPLSFGTHAWIPELTSTVQLTRNGATIKETTVQPRSRHINCLPMLGMIEVKGLSVLRNRVDLDVTVP